MPRPPPPAEALRITGYPISAAASRASSTDCKASVPGTIGTPASRATRRAVALSPKARMFSGVGPMKVIP